MRVRVTGMSTAERVAFCDGWRASGAGTDIAILPGSDLPQDAPALIVHESGQVDRYDEAAPTPLASTAPFAAAVRSLLDDDAALLLGPALAHDGGAGLWGALSEAERRRLAARAPGLRVGALQPTPLLSLHGRAAELAEAYPEVAGRAQDAERTIGRFVQDMAERGGRVPHVQRLARAPGSGMAGGCAFVLAALGAELQPAARVVAAQFWWAEQLRETDLLVALADEVDPVDIAGGTFATLGALAADADTAFAVIATAADMPRRTLANAGITDQYARGTRTWTQVGRSLANTWDRG